MATAIKGRLSGPDMDGNPRQHSESLATARADARRERLLDMQRRLRPYRTGCFAILAVALVAASAEQGWWWMVPLGVAFAGFAVVDRFMHRSAHPAIWVVTAWAITPLLLADAVVVTGGPTSPALMWMALPAVTLGARFDTRGMVLGTAYILALLLIATVAFDPTEASENSQMIIASVALVLSTVILSGALVESDRAHRRRSTLDPLTGLFNRNALEQRLGELDGQPSDPEAGAGASYSLLLCDLDNFKEVNDSRGHAAGDAVLQDIAYVMRAELRASDTIYRVGGEEILVILPSADREAAVEIAERLRRTVRDRRPAGIDVTISIGVAVSSRGPVNTDDLVARADSALYEAKDLGRDRVCVDA